MKFIRVIGICQVISFQAKLRELRGPRSLLDIEKATGITKIEISRYERGKYYPTPEKLKKLAKFFGIAYADLRKLYYQETLLDPEEQEAITKWVVDNVPKSTLMNLMK